MPPRKKIELQHYIVGFLEDNEETFLLCKINLRETIRYSYIAKSYKELLIQYNWILETFEPTVSKLKRVYNQHSKSAWHNLKQLNIVVPELKQLKERIRNVKTVWKMRPKFTV